MGHYASEMGFGGESDHTRERRLKLEALLRQLKKLKLSDFPADMAGDLAMVTGIPMQWKSDQERAVDRVTAYLDARRKRLRRRAR